jgi:hypothetical protein
MRRQERLIREWFDQRAQPGEALAGWGLLANYPSNPNQPSGRGMQRREYVEAAGLDPDRRLLPGVTHPFAAVSNERLLLGRQGGFRFNPKEELLSLHRSTFVVRWWDEQHPGPDERHVVVEVSDGTWWDTSTVINDNHNTHGLFDALGANAVRVDR